VGLFQCVQLKCDSLLTCFAIEVVFWLV